jgi:hypothetical protein
MRCLFKLNRRNKYNILDILSRKLPERNIRKGLQMIQKLIDHPHLLHLLLHHHLHQLKLQNLQNKRLNKPLNLQNKLPPLLELQHQLHQEVLQQLQQQLQ